MSMARLGHVFVHAFGFKGKMNSMKWETSSWILVELFIRVCALESDVSYVTEVIWLSQINPL